MQDSLKVLIVIIMDIKNAVKSLKILNDSSFFLKIDLRIFERASTIYSNIIQIDLFRCNIGD